MVVTSTGTSSALRAVTGHRPEVLVHADRFSSSTASKLAELDASTIKGPLTPSTAIRNDSYLLTTQDHSNVLTNRITRNMQIMRIVMKYHKLRVLIVSVNLVTTADPHDVRLIPFVTGAGLVVFSHVESIRAAFMSSSPFRVDLVLTFNVFGSQ
jgi:hypothetical protein